MRAGSQRPVEFRPLRRGDIPSLVRMSRENMAAIVKSSWGMEWQDEPLLEWFMDKDIQTEVLEEGGEAVGYYSLEPIDKYLFITSVQLRKDHQGKGHGRHLMERIEDIARQQGADGVELCVQDSNDNAKGFYDHIGYSVICRRGNNFLMRKRLGR
ncbi:MAG: putative acetyltransferase [Methanomassiliicoccales archaeon PtaU1.Bin124]|nr:MAG: putative acetyltransferase [Methanomassiliicoccales archaeon PtaU1.Bin124]